MYQAVCYLSAVSMQPVTRTAEEYSIKYNIIYLLQHKYSIILVEYYVECDKILDYNKEYIQVLLT